MKRLLLTALLFGLAAGFLPAQSDDETTARQMALNLAGAFGNDGFKLRDGHWTGPLAKGKPVVVQVNLFRGNEYWFSASASAQARNLQITVFDEAGQELESETREAVFDADGNMAAEGGDGPLFHAVAAALTATVSGPCYIRIEQTDGDPAAVCLVYSYR